MHRVSIFHKDAEYVFYRQNFIVGDGEVKGLTSEFLIKKINLQPDEAVFVFIAGYTDRNVEQLSKFILENKIKKIYFFVEDVFRMYNVDAVSNHEIWFTDNYPLPIDLTKTSIIELDIITEIIKNTNVNCEIFHCELNTRMFEQKYNLKINYYDWFVADESLSNKLPTIKKLVPKEKFNEYLKFTNSFSYKICNFNLRPTINRCFMASLLCQEPDTCITWHSELTDETLYNQRFSLENFDPTIKEKIINGFNQLKLKNYHLPNEDLSILVDGNGQYHNLIKVQDSFIQIVSETSYLTNMPNFSEKTLKSILMWRPFIIMAAPGTLQLIKDLGIKTFSNWWDESYDTITDDHQRFSKIYNLSKWILSKSHDELKEMLDDMKPTLEHNRVKLFILKQTMWNYMLSLK